MTEKKRPQHCDDLKHNDPCFRAEHPKFTFRHATFQGTHWIKGPWIVEGPHFSMALDDRTKAAILTKKLNEMEKARKESK